MATLARSSQWQYRLAPGVDVIEAMAIEAFARLPLEFRLLCGDILIKVAEFPDEEAMDDLGVDSPYEILGLFHGTGLAQQGAPQTGQLPNVIWLYRRPLLDYWLDYEERLGDLVTHVLVHEIGHHFGLSDDDMEKIEASVAA